MELPSCVHLANSSSLCTAFETCPEPLAFQMPLSAPDDPQTSSVQPEVFLKLDRNY